MTAAGRIETFSGVGFYPLAARVDDIHVRDIAHALSLQCRFSGHCRRHYSVAEHSINVLLTVRGWGCSPDVQRWALLHDASEAYLVDLPTPLKVSGVIGDAYRKAEAILMAKVAARFGLPGEQPAIVTKADLVMLSTEVRDLMYGRAAHWAGLREAPHTARMSDQAPSCADVETAFLNEAANLGVY